jgi:pyruvate dehydrogenase E1 component
MFEASMNDDADPSETREWLESIDSVLRTHGPERAQYLLERVIDFTRRSGAYLPFKPNTAYVNTISVGQEQPYPGDRALERRIEAYLRWNAMAMVVQANRQSTEYGGHIASYASAATLYEVGFNHFWRATSDAHPGDLVFIQGHSRRASMRALTSKGGSPRSSCAASARRSAAAGCPPIRTRG